MSVWEILDSRGFEDLRIGDGRATTRDRFGEHETFRRTPNAPETDHFPAAGVLVTYGSDDRVVFIEVTAPADPTIRTISVIDRSLDDAVAELRAAGIDVILDVDGARLEGWGVGLYAPEGIVEGVSIGE